MLRRVIVAAALTVASTAGAGIIYQSLNDSPVPAEGLRFLPWGWEDMGFDIWADAQTGCVTVQPIPRDCGGAGFIRSSRPGIVAGLPAGALIEAPQVWWDSDLEWRASLWDCTDPARPGDWSEIGSVRYIGFVIDHAAGPNLPVMGWLGVRNTDGTPQGFRLTGLAVREEIGVPIFAGDTSGMVPCPADYNRDGGIDGADMAVFFDNYWLGCNYRADVNGDGYVNRCDLAMFLETWESGGC